MSDAKVVPATDELKVVTVKMPPSLLNAIDYYATNYGLYRSEVIRLAIIKFLEKELGSLEVEKE